MNENSIIDKELEDDIFNLTVKENLFNQIEKEIEYIDDMYTYTDYIGDTVFSDFGIPKVFDETIEYKELLESNESFLSLNFYHASPSKYDKVIKPIAPNYGTKLYDPHWAVYMWKDKSLAYPYCLFTYIHKFMQQNFSKEERKDKLFEYIKYGVYYMTKDVYEALKEHCVGKIVYVYTINVPLKDFIHIKLGHTNDFPEYSLDKEATIINREEIKITEKYFDKYVMVTSVSSIKKMRKESAKEKEKNPTNILYNTNDDAHKVAYKFYIANAHCYLDTNKDLNEVLSNDKLMIEAFNKELNTADYGIVVNGKPYTGKNIDYNKYKTLSPKEFEKYYTGICWDYTEYEANQFEEIFDFKHTLNDLREKEYSMYYMVLKNKDGDTSCHTWLAYKLYGKIYSFESSWEKYKGITEFSSEEDMLYNYISKYKKEYSEGEVVISKYPKNTKFGLGCEEFMNRCINTGKVIYSEIDFIPIDEAYEKMPMILSEDDIYCNMSKFKNPYNIIFVCGTSGSGKSTLSKQIRDMYNIHWVSLDSLMFWLVRKERTPEDVLNQDPILYKYLVEHNIDFNYLYHKYGNDDKLKKLGLKKVKELGSNKEIRKMTVDFCKWISKQKDLYCVIEGLQTTFLHDNKEFISYPFIFKGTSMLKAWYRRIKRDNSSIWLTPSRWEDAVRWTKEWKHDVDRLRKAVISNSTDIYTKKEEDIQW